MIGFLGHCWVTRYWLRHHLLKFHKSPRSFQLLRKVLLAAFRVHRSRRHVLANESVWYLRLTKTCTCQHVTTPLASNILGRIRYNITVAQQSITIITSGWESEICFSAWPYWGHQQKLVGWNGPTWISEPSCSCMFVTDNLQAFHLDELSWYIIEWHSQWLTFKMLGGYIFSFKKMQEIVSSVLRSRFYFM